MTTKSRERPLVAAGYVGEVGATDRAGNETGSHQVSAEDGAWLRESDTETKHEVAQRQVKEFEPDMLGELPLVTRARTASRFREVATL